MVQFNEIGKTGLVYYAGSIDEEWLNDFRGISGIKKIKQMRDNDAIIGAIRFSIKNLISNVEWHVKPADENNAKDKEIAEFVESCLYDMSSSWYNTLIEILSFLDFGWSYHEIIYKKRLGRNKNSSKNSKYDDGKIGWRKISIRAQETLDKWEIDENGGILGMHQVAPPNYTRHFIPIEKALHFTTERHKGNPEGRSIYRNAFRSWYYKKNLEEVEGIGVERDLAGLPVAYVPPRLLSKKATADEIAILTEIKKFVKRVRRNENEGCVYPNSIDESGKETGYKFELLSGNSKRQFDTNKIISRYSKQMAMTVLATFILMGMEETGTFALSKTITELFITAIETYLKQICEVINTHGIPRLVDLNGYSGFSGYPELTYNPIKSDLDKLSSVLTSINSTGINLTDLETENYIRSLAGLPLKSDSSNNINETVS